MRRHRKRNQIHFRQIKNKHISNLNFDLKNNDCDIIVNKYNNNFSDLLDGHALVKTLRVPSRHLNRGNTVCKTQKKIWRDSKLTVLLEIYRNSCLIKISRYDSSCQRKPFFKYISNYNGQSKEISQLVNSLLGRNKQTVYIQYDCDSTLVSSFNSFLLITFLIYVQVELPL